MKMTLPMTMRRVSRPKIPVLGVDLVFFVVLGVKREDIPSVGGAGAAAAFFFSFLLGASTACELALPSAVSGS